MTFPYVEKECTFGSQPPILDAASDIYGPQDYAAPVGYETPDILNNSTVDHSECL